ncbi:MAG: endoglucanase (Endo,4-beta-glucanase) [Armatimonadetes bacterium]|nr:endoglucanase (Endo,4-beta-glucanase) [Armatimonadota bacterium]
MELLRELCEAVGIPGREERIRAIVRREMEPLVDEVRVDRLGNLVGIRRGSSGKRLAINAHLDEIGFVVTHVEDGGFLRLHPLGGHDSRNMVAQRVRVMTSPDLLGVLYVGQKPPHLLDGPVDKPPKPSEFFVDVGLDRDEVARRVPVGTPVVIHREFAEMGDTVTCKALDNRLSVYVMLEALRRTRASGWDVYAVATVQEEVGIRGAITSAFEVEPDAGLALDITIAADIPGVPDHERVTRLGAGTAIKILDSYSISSPLMVEALRQLAEERGIPHQMEILPRGGTDAGALQRARSGAPVCTISTPTRYVHTSIETSSKRDIEASIALTAAFIEDGHRFNYQPE